MTDSTGSPRTRLVEKKPNRKPMDKLNGYDSREAMWAEIRAMRTFTVRELKEATTLKIESVREYVTGLTNGGFLERDDSQILNDKGFGKNSVIYTLIRNVGVDAPRVRKDGSTVTQGQGTANMWRTMRILGTFSARELAVSASTDTCVIAESTAASYIRHLCDAGYIRKGKYLFRFITAMYTGPKPPMVQRVKRVWDQNLKKVMWSEVGPEYCPIIRRQQNDQQ